MVVLVPELAQMSHHIRNFVIGYIHLTMLGIITGFLFGSALQSKILNSQNVVYKRAIQIFLIGFVATEILLFLQGFYLFFKLGMLPHYYLSLFIGSLPLALGLLMITGSLILTLKRKHLNAYNNQ